MSKQEDILKGVEIKRNGKEFIAMVPIQYQLLIPTDCNLNFINFTYRYFVLQHKIWGNIVPKSFNTAKRVLR